jgi:hypothetical protein
VYLATIAVAQNYLALSNWMMLKNELASMVKEAFGFY